MRKNIAIEDIEDMRRRQGIDDVELRLRIRELASGDLVRLTILSDTHELVKETVLVRITSIHGWNFRGKLVSEPGRRVSSDLHAGSTVMFTTDHIHSLAERPTPMTEKKSDVKQQTPRRRSRAARVLAGAAPVQAQVAESAREPWRDMKRRGKNRGGR